MGHVHSIAAFRFRIINTDVTKQPKQLVIFTTYTFFFEIIEHITTFMSAGDS
jgi:hypothetical protein